MNAKKRLSVPARTAFTLLAVAVLLFAGCKEEKKNLVWSPDGSRAAIIANGGLCFCDAEGRLTPVLVPGVYRVAWLSDSHQLALARERQSEIKDWAGVVKEFGQIRADAVVARAEGVWLQLRGQQQSKETAEKTLARMLEEEAEGDLMAFYLIQHHSGAEIKFTLSEESEKWQKDWQEARDKGLELDVYEVVMARIDGDQVSVGVPLDKVGVLFGTEIVSEIRPSPNDRAIAWVYNNSGTRLMLSQLNKPGAASVADHVAHLPDWMPDGRTLVYFQASSVSDGSNLRLGALVRRKVLNAEGDIDVQPEENLAGVIFNDNARVQCLSDQRIIFNAAEISLPIATSDFGAGREQLFALAPNAPTLTRLIPRKAEADLPQLLTQFEVSPDERQVVLGSNQGEVSVLTLATGEVEKIPVGKDADITCLPVWRKSGELTFFRCNRAVLKSSRLGEVVLKSGKEEKVLSQDWPDPVVNSFFSQDSKKQEKSDKAKK